MLSYYLLFTDVHLDDRADNDYRWMIFEHVRTALVQYDVAVAFCLGDLVDRRDKFSAAFVNRLLGQLRGVAARAPLVILMGNHDMTPRPPNYFDWLNSFAGEASNIQYVTAPAVSVDDPRLLILPYSHHPREEWAKFRLSDYEAAFMHATVTGSRVENGQVMENSDFPLLPGRVKFYSGDVHVPQKVRNVTYVGAPHPIKFGDDYPCRMLLLDRDFNVAMEIPLTGPRKRIIRVDSMEDLGGDLDLRHGDQVKIECRLSADQVDRWSLDETRLAAWAKRLGITVAGVSAVLESSHGDVEVDPSQSPEALLRQFAEREGISSDLLAAGLRLLGEAR